MRSLRVGGDQRQRGQVIARDPGRRVRVQHAGPVPQPQHQPAPVRPDPHPQHGIRRQRARTASRIKHHLKGRPGHAKLTQQITHREALVPQQLPLRPAGLSQQRPPRTRTRAQPARQRHPARRGNIPRHHLGLTRQHRQHPGMRGQQHRAQRHAHLGRPHPQRRQQVAGNGRFVSGDAGHRIGGPPRDRGEPATGQHAAPELAVRINESLRQADSRHLTSPSPGSAPPRVRRDFLALHQERVRGEHRALAHRHAVMDHRADPDGAARADRAPVGLERAVLLRVALDLLPALSITSSPTAVSVRSVR